LRNLVGNTREITRTFNRPKPVVKDSTKSPGDSTKRPPPRRRSR
jgi:hypothetical protein